MRREKSQTLWWSAAFLVDMPKKPAHANGDMDLGPLVQQPCKLTSLVIKQVIAIDAVIIVTRIDRVTDACLTRTGPEAAPPTHEAGPQQSHSAVTRQARSNHHARMRWL